MSGAGALFAWAVPLQAGMIPPPPVRIPGGHTRTIFSILIRPAMTASADNAPAPDPSRACTVARPETCAGEQPAQASVSMAANEDAGCHSAVPLQGLCAGSGAGGRGHAAGKAELQGGPSGLQMITTSLDRSVLLWHVPYAAGGVASDAWKRAKVCRY